MPDQPIPDRIYGTGAVQSPPDERDYQIEELLAATAPEVLAAALPSRYTVPTLPPILDQANTPMCVAFSSSAMKARQDKLDMGTFFNFDEAWFFGLIGGTASGAIARNALERMLRYGYPVYGVGDAGRHRIASYFAVPKNIATIKQAILAFGPLLMTGPWFHNWIYGLPASKILPRPDYGGNGHQVLVVGWDDAKGLLFQNSWGSAWGSSGRAWMPYYYVVNTMWELWKTVDVRSSPKPAPGTWNGRARVAGPNCNIRTSAVLGSTNIFARSHTDGFTYRTTPSGALTKTRLWANTSLFLFGGKFTNDFAEVKSGSGQVLHIHRSVCQIVVAA